MEKDTKKTFSVQIEYKDETGFDFEVTLEGKSHDIYANLMMITRGTLMASNGYRAIAYNDEGFDVCSYINNYGKGGI